MATCSRCRRPITSAQSRQAVTVTDPESGKPKGAKHGKCARLDARAANNDRLADAGIPRIGDAPDPYTAAAKFGGERRLDAEYAAAAKASSALADERAAGLDERRHDNWRTEATVTIDDLTPTGEVLDLEEL